MCVCVCVYVFICILIAHGKRLCRVQICLRVSARLLN